MSNLIKHLVDTARHFTGADFAVFKICLISIGILLGSYFGAFFLEYISFIWLIAMITWGILIIRVFRNYKK